MSPLRCFLFFFASSPSTALPSHFLFWVSERDILQDCLPGSCPFVNPRCIMRQSGLGYMLEPGRPPGSFNPTWHRTGCPFSFSRPFSSVGAVLAAVAVSSKASLAFTFQSSYLSPSSVPIISSSALHLLHSSSKPFLVSLRWRFDLQIALLFITQCRQR